MSKTKRCIDCEDGQEHELEEICPSCGRCAKHCKRDNHTHMEPIDA